MSHEPHRLAWLRINAYGLLLVGLTMLSIFDILEPSGSTVANAIGYVSPWQPLWSAGIFLGGLCLLLGFVRARTTPELVGLLLLSASVTLQAGVVVTNAPPSDAVPRLIVWAVVVGCSILRATALLSRDGLTVTIPGRRRP